MIKKLIVKSLLFLILVFLMLACVHFIPVDKNQYLAAIVDKHNALSSTPGSRLIAIGGSNVAYGFDSEKLAAMINRPVINMGLHAYLGLKFMLNDLFPYIHSGDIILIIPEYLQFYNDYFNGYGYKLAELLDTYPQGIWSLDAHQLFNTQEHYAPLLRSKIFRYYSTIEINPLYNRQLFNQYGDINKEIKSISHSSIRDIPYITGNDWFNVNAAIFLNDFNQKVMLKGARVFLVYPAGRMTNCQLTGLRLDDLDKKLREVLDFPILLNPSSACIDDIYFKDTEYHMSNEGTELRMNLIGDFLISYGFLENKPNDL